MDAGCAPDRSGRSEGDAGDDARSEAATPARAIAGDPATAAALVDRLGPRVPAFANRMTGDDRALTEDLVQEAFPRLWRRAARDGLDADVLAHFSTQLFRVAANFAIDARRRTAREAPLPEADAMPDDAPSALARLIATERILALDAARRMLPVRPRMAVVLRHVEGVSNPDVAAMVGCGVEAVESLTARGRRRLAELLRPEPEG